MTVEEKLKEINEALDNFETNSGLPKMQSPGPEVELNEYLNMPREYLTKLSVEDLGEIMVRLNQFAFYLQRLQNKAQATLTGAEAYLKALVTPQLNQYDKYWKYEIKVEAIAKTDSSVQKLSQIVRKVKQRIERLNGLSYSIRNISESLLAMQRGKIHMANITR
jgi:hypothetical protein